MTVIAANVALAAAPRVRYVDVVTAAELQAACEARFAAADVLLMAAAVADFRPAAPADGKLKKDRREELSSRSSGRRTCCPDSPPAAARARRWSASPPSTARARWTRARSSPQGPRRGRRQRRLAPGHRLRLADNEVTIVTAAGEHHVPRAPKVDIAGAILDAVDGLRSGERTTA